MSGFGLAGFFFVTTTVLFFFDRVAVAGEGTLNGDEGANGEAAQLDGMPDNGDGTVWFGGTGAFAFPCSGRLAVRLVVGE